MNDKVNILIVDDLPEKLLVLDSVLEELGQNVIAARSGQEALRCLLEHDFAVILLDVNMPGMDGYETAALIRRRKKSAHTPIIFVTAYADEVHTAQGYSLGAVDYVLAPVVPEILRTKVKVFVDLFVMAQQIQRRAEEQVALARAEAARSAAEEELSRLNFLAEASKVLASSLDLERAVRGLLGLVLPRFGDRGILTLFSEAGQIHRLELAWIDANKGLQTTSGLTSADGRLQNAMQAALGQVQALARGEDLTPIASALWSARDGNGTASQEFKPLLSLPLVARGRTLGLLFLARTPRPKSEAERQRRAREMPCAGAQALTQADLTLIEDLAHRAAIAIDNAELYRNIQEADRRKNEFLSMLAHELRNPLAPLLNGIQILRMYGPKQLEVQKVQDMMDRQVHHLVRLVDDLLDISRITQGKVQLHMEPVEVRTVVDRAVEVSRPLLDARQHALTVSLPDEPVRVNADPVRLAQVLSNLLNNAAKYTEKGGQVLMVVEHEGADVAFRVRDNGMGIPVEMLASVFDLFTQVDRALDRSQGGLGIGLTLVRRLVEMHGGTVQAFSSGTNEGSEFIVRLPIAVQRETPAAVTGTTLPGSAQQEAHRRVLIVDDNADVADSTALLLRQIDLEVKVTHDGPAALVAAQDFKPEIVLLDIGLPGMDGYEVARRLRQEAALPRLLLVALSGYGQEEDRQRSVEAGFDHHLVKPASLQELRAIFAAGPGR